MPRQPRRRANTYTKPVSAMLKTELTKLCGDLELATEGSVVDLRKRLKDFLTQNRNIYANNPRYKALYPRRRGQVLNPPGQPHAPQPPPSPTPSLSNASTWAGIAVHGEQHHQQEDHSRHSTPALVHPPENLNIGEYENDNNVVPDIHIRDPTPEPVREQNPIENLTSTHKRPNRIPGVAATNAAFLVPDHIRKKFADGWNIHVPLTYLTDKGCTFKSKVSDTESHNILTLDDSNGRILTASKPLSDEGEFDLTFDEWHQGWRRLLELIQAFLPAEYKMWEEHHLFIHRRENRAELWPLYLAYDIEIRKRATRLPIDPSVFSIGIWNDLEARYMAKKVYTQVQMDLKQNPSRGNYTPSSSSRQQYPNYNTSRNQSFRSHPYRSNSNDYHRQGKCIFCGDTSRSHTPRSCNATNLTNGSPCFLLKQGPMGTRQDKNGNRYCFAWNGYSGCEQGQNCQRGEHWCSLCGEKTHNAQQCISTK